MTEVASAIPAAALLLARRFSSGATLWAVAPGRDDHARHVAVEFVHPVIVGSPTLPSVAITGSDLVGQARALVQPGDILILIGEAAAFIDLAARAEAWGAAVVWLCLGDPPPNGAADVVVNCEHEADVVLSYHLLWELCHVCLQHPGVLATAPAEGTCVVCSDEAVTAEVTGVADRGMLQLRTACGAVEAADLVGQLAVGDLVVVHAATVIGRRV